MAKTFNFSSKIWHKSMAWKIAWKRKLIIRLNLLLVLFCRFNCIFELSDKLNGRQIPMQSCICNSIKLVLRAYEQMRCSWAHLLVLCVYRVSSVCMMMACSDTEWTKNYTNISNYHINYNLKCNAFFTPFTQHTHTHFGWSQRIW